MFGTSGIRGPVGKDVTAGLALDLGRALAVDTDRVVVGRDCRSTGRFLEDALTAGLRECGTTVIRLGQVSTPTVARSVEWQDAHAGVAVTASHNPPPDNGFKLWQPSGQAFDESLRDTIETRIDGSTFKSAAWDGVGDARTWPTAEARHIREITAGLDEVSLSVVVDVGNGTGGVTADTLIELGSTVETLNAQPDGRFPGRPSEPTAEHCASLCHLVGTSDADLGIAHDGDADRMLAVDETGSWIPGDVLLAVFATHAASRGDEVAVPVDTSLAVDDALAEIGATTTRTRVGDVFVAERASEPNIVFGGEPSGAWIWPNETLCPDGPFAAAKLAELVDEHGPLSQLVGDIQTYPIRRGNFETTDKPSVMHRITDRVSTEYDAVHTLDGIRVEVDDAWFLVRPSGTQPLIRVTAEARDETRADAVFEAAQEIVSTAIAE